MLKPYWDQRRLYLLQYDYKVVHDLLVRLDVIPDYHFYEEPFDEELDILKTKFENIESERRKT